MPGPESGGEPVRRRRVLRAAHITDVHITPEHRAPEGFAACLRDIQKLDDPVDLILNTGDSVMCVNGVDRTSAQTQWDLFTRVLADNNAKPVVHCLGNHDVYQMGRACRGESLQDGGPSPGKAWAVEALRMPDRYFRAERGGWAFLSLDGIGCHGGGYTARLDEAQFAWLETQLRELPPTTPVCILTHIPIVTACGYFDGDRVKDNDWVVPGSWMHVDARRLKDLFLKHRNVRLCLSGHMHQLDRIEFNGVWYCCSGAVSASWWKGLYYECGYGYGLLDFYSDGGFDWSYRVFPWPL
ncbi:MAG: metallophosphoesterase family protein [Phycisphaerales bacterium]